MVVGTYRILTSWKAKERGRFYSESECDLTNLKPLTPRLVEVGRSCIHPEYRQGAVITLLAVTGLTHREAYKDIFVITLTKTAAVFVVIAVYYLTGIY